jgi:hypothetical protein
MQKAKPIITVLRVIITIMYGLVALFTLLFFIQDVYNIMDKSDRFSDNLNFNVMAFGPHEAATHYTYLKDSTIRYQPSPGQYTLQAKPATTIGYYAVGVKLVHAAFVLLILWTFRRVLDELKPERPFSYNIIRKLRLLALLFIASDLFSFVDYLATNALLPGSGFKLVISVGTGFITGMSIWVLSVVFQQGLNLQTENELTV